MKGAVDGGLDIPHSEKRVVGHVTSEDVSAVNVGVQLLGLGVVAGEPLLRVGNVETSIDSSLHGGEDLSPSGGPSQTNIKTGAECSRSIVIVLDGVHGAINIGVALVHGVQLELLEDSAGEQESR